MGAGVDPCLRARLFCILSPRIRRTGAAARNVARRGSSGEKELAILRIQLSSTYRLEPDDNPGGDPKVVLRAASELRQQVVSLNYAPSELVGDPGINAASERHRKGRIPETRRAIMRSSKE
jgi:hypothetical protein